MNFPLKLDATFLSSWSNCREQVRQSFVEERAPITPSIYYEYGIAIHIAVQKFWEGCTFEQAIAAAYEHCNKYPVQRISTNLYLTKKWSEMVEQLPDLVACYFDNVEQDVGLVLQIPAGLAATNPASRSHSKVQGVEQGVIETGAPTTSGPGSLQSRRMIEHEWSIPYSDDVILCGRIDRAMVGPELPDVKTASEISNYGVPWKTGYQNGKMLEMQFGLYDWYFQKLGMPLKRVYLEVLIKGYKSKPCRLEIIELPHVTTETYRARFRQQLAWKVSEIVHYFRNYREQSPWPMSGGSACKTVFGECEMLPICLHGPIPRVLELYQIRQEHLECRKEGVK